ncbi:hypothetical protein AWC38_SpisGene11984 [Stylophora pistillata]|uniref:Uncharacterized protein n=1 Tax=Stylophora pistillata TaxID=50429 RepID=A0A2B4S0R6_STYPI|nr:hypothetical protein AWC38_SpisGene11984 [Stylophora pistillata]
MGMVEGLTTYLNKPETVSFENYQPLFSSDNSLVGASSGGKSPKKMQKDRPQPSKKKETKKAAMDKLKKSIFLPELPVKEPPKLIAPKIVPDGPWKYSEPQPTTTTTTSTTTTITTRKQEDTETDTEPGEIAVSSECTMDAFLREVLDEAIISYPCPIHNTPMEELKAKDPTSSAVYLRCAELNCPVFTNLNDYSVYYYECRKQGHRWYTLDRIHTMQCECGVAPSLSLSESEHNFHKINLRCIENVCGLFTFWRIHPRKKTMGIFNGL